VTDLGYCNYIEKHGTGCINMINSFIHDQKELFIRLGLGREFTAKNGSDRTGYWLQVNGIYTYPKYYKAIRCYD
ncbi:MAG: hypothetical protein ABIH39_07575, partial [Candidatus Margulisiibacteriota bacterium]